MFGDSLFLSTQSRTISDSSSNIRRDEHVYKPGIFAVAFVKTDDLVNDSGEVGKWFDEKGILDDEDYTSLSNLIQDAHIQNEEKGNIVLRWHQDMLRFGVMQEFNSGGKKIFGFTARGVADRSMDVLKKISDGCRTWIFAGGAASAGRDILEKDRICSARVDGLSVLRLASYVKEEWNRSIDECLATLDTVESPTEVFGLLCLFGGVHGINVQGASILTKCGTWRTTLRTLLSIAKTSVNAYTRSKRTGEDYSIVASYRKGPSGRQTYNATFSGGVRGSGLETDIEIA